MPLGTFAPYNAQATLHFYDAFWALYLPVTVAGRVSDIWRSYFSQALFQHLGLSIGFMPRPLVSQDRNPHSVAADFEAELPLYLKTGALVQLIKSLSGKSSHYKSLPEMMEAFWIMFYERGYVALEDVFHLQNWIEALLQLGYQFPMLQPEKIRSNSMNDIVLLKEWQGGMSSYEQSKRDYGHHSDFECDLDPFSVTFGNSDLHEGTRAYFASVVSHVNQNIVLLGLDGKIKNYPTVNDMPGVIVHGKKSYALQKYVDHSTKLTQSMIDDNLQYYKYDKNLKVSCMALFIERLSVLIIIFLGHSSFHLLLSCKHVPNVDAVQPLQNCIHASPQIQLGPMHPF